MPWETDQVYGIAMPTRFSSHSLEDAEELARNLNIHFHNIPIEPVFQAYLEILKPHFKDMPEDLTEENLQPREFGEPYSWVCPINSAGWF